MDVNIACCSVSRDMSVFCAVIYIAGDAVPQKRSAKGASLLLIFLSQNLQEARMAFLSGLCRQSSGVLRYGSVQQSQLKGACLPLHPLVFHRVT